MIPKGIDTILGEHRAMFYENKNLHGCATYISKKICIKKERFDSDLFLSRVTN